MDPKHEIIVMKAAELGSLLRERGLSVSVAESCTAGGIGSAIASIDGASEYFVGGVIAYATGIKTDVLGVEKSVIDRYGVVSEQTVLAMNERVLAMMKSDIAISVSGYIGSSGGDSFAENGTVWYCVGGPSIGVHTQCLKLSNTRSGNVATVILSALSTAIELLRP